MDLKNNDVKLRNRIVTREEWLAARKKFLKKEKELTRLRDKLNTERRKLPWVKLEKEYVFEGLEGKVTLPELFEGRSQLIINHFMLGPGWKEGCVGCSFGMDHTEGALVHLNHHDVSFVTVSRAPIDEIEPFRKRMGWQVKWVSSFGSDFNYDFNVSFSPEDVAAGRVEYNYKMQDTGIEELSGLSVFYKNASGEIFHTYSAYGRGGEEALSTYVFLDMTPKGRNENGPHFSLTDWVRHHDRYDSSGYVESTGRYVGEENSGDSCCEVVRR